MLGIETTLVADDVFRKLSELDIYAHYIEGFKVPNLNFCSELRKDKSPSCFIYKHSDKWFYKDRGTNDVLTCFGYVMQKLKTDYQGALAHILTHVTKNKEFPQNYAPYHCDIEINTRSFTQVDLNYWGQYGATTTSLGKFNILPLSRYIVTKGNSATVNYCETPTYSIEAGDGKRRKIYAPFGDIKWQYTQVGNWIMGYDQLPWTESDLVITKSMKDVITWDVVSVAAIAPHSESQNVPKSFLRGLEKRFTNIVVNYDNDEAGLKFGNKLALENDYKTLFILDELKCKDISDTFKTHGIEMVEQIKNSFIIKPEENAIPKRI